MENWPVRPSMNGLRPNNLERRDGGGYANPPAYVSIRRKNLFHPIRERGFRRFSGSAASYLDAYDNPGNTSFVRARYSIDVEGSDHLSSSCSSGYLQTSSQLVFHPDSRVSEDSKSEEPPEWNLIAQVSVFDKEGVACPICLHPPVAPRMERCGHIYCWPCLLQYIKYDNDTSAKKCAVCSWILNLKDIKRVSLVKVEPVLVGSTIEMILLTRFQLSPSVTRAFMDTKDQTDQAFKRHQATRIATGHDMLSMIEDEIQILKTYKAVCEADEFSLELIPFVDTVIDELLQEQACALKSDYGASTNLMTQVASQSDDQIYFYQASDGQPIYLDGLMWKCLITEYRDAVNLPRTLKAQVLSITSHRMNKHFRKRLKYLSHLPLGAEFSLIEIALAPPLISEATLSLFAKNLDSRAVERERHQLEELELTKLKEEVENQIPGLAPGFVLSSPAELTDRRKIPFSASDFMPLSSSPVEDVESKTPLTMSFAEVTRSGASSVVGYNRIANFSKSAPNSRSPGSLVVDDDYWPSLGESISGIQHHSQDLPNHPSSSGDHTTNTGSHLHTKAKRKSKRKKRDSDSSVVIN